MKVEIRILSVENEAVTVRNAGLKTLQVIQQVSCILLPAHTVLLGTKCKTFHGQRHADEN